MKNKLLSFPDKKPTAPFCNMGNKTPNVRKQQPSPATTLVSLTRDTTRCQEPQSRPIISQLACSEARTGSPEHRNCSFCRSTLGRTGVECACCGPLHVKCSAGMNRAKDWRRRYVCGCCKQPPRVKEMDEKNHSSGLS